MKDSNQVLVCVDLINVSAKKSVTRINMKIHDEIITVNELMNENYDSKMISYL